MKRIRYRRNVCNSCGSADCEYYTEIPCVLHFHEGSKKKKIADSIFLCDDCFHKWLQTVRSK